MCQAVCSGMAAQNDSDLCGTREIALLEIGELEALKGGAQLDAGLESVSDNDGIISEEEIASMAFHGAGSD